MLYLAVVQRKFLPRSLGLKLLAVKRADGLWREIAKPEVITIPPSVTDLADDRLVVVGLNPKREVVSLTPGTTAIPSILHQLSVQIFKLKKDEEDVEAWRMSLEFQSSELSDRREALNASEEALKVEQELNTRQRSSLEHDAKVLASDRAALQAAWEAVRLEQKRLKDD